MSLEKELFMWHRNWSYVELENFVQTKLIPIVENHYNDATGYSKNIEWEFEKIKLITKIA